MTLQPFETKFKAIIQKVSLDSDILAVLLFGSHARQEATKDSDIDVCLMLMPKVNAQIGFDKRIAYMADFEIDAHIYQQVPLYIRQRILKEGKILHCKDENLLYEVACQTITEFADYENFYYEYLKEIERG